MHLDRLLWTGLGVVVLFLFIVRPWAETAPEAELPADPAAEAEALYEQAIGELETAIESEADNAPAGLGDAIASEQKALDDAIAESRRRAAADPSDETARESVLDGLRRKLDLFHNTLMLLRDMERGDSVDAQDRIEALSGRSPPETG